jgi:transposase
MQDVHLFHLALGLQEPWQVTATKLDLTKSQLDITISFRPGSKFRCPVCSRAGCSVYDSLEHTWRHLNFFQYHTYLTARVPRVNCEQCGVRLVEVPWARSGTGFTLMFEALVMTLVQQMPVRAASRIMGEHDTRLWRIVEYHVQTARAKLDFSAVTAVGIDETASRRGHRYVTLFADLNERRVLFATEGKDAETVSRFRADLFAHNNDGGMIQDVCCDMSPAFIQGIEVNMPDSSITFDKFHLMKLVNEAVDLVRQEEQHRQPALKKTRFAWLTNPGHHSLEQAETIARLSMKQLNLQTARAYRMKLVLQELWEQPAALAGAFLKNWYQWAVRSQLAPVLKLARTIKRHWQGILNWFQSRISNGIMEGINSLVQAAKARARGYRTAKNLIIMICLIAGKLNFAHTK